MPPTLSSEVRTLLKKAIEDAGGRTGEDLGRDVLRHAMTHQPTTYGKFRDAVMFACMTRHFKQAAGKTRALLAAENGNPIRFAARPEEEEEEERGDLDDGMRFDESAEGRWPPQELLIRAANAFEAPKNWAKLAEKQPESPVAFYAFHVFRQVMSQTRLGGDRGPVQDRAPTGRGAQHQVAQQLDHLLAADPACGGFCREARNMYGDALTGLLEYLRGDDAGPGSAAYALRKLFPDHAWPPVGSSARSALAEWLVASVDARVGPGLTPERAAALAVYWGAEAPRPLQTGLSVREGLDAAATAHDQRDGFPTWPEIALWTGEHAPHAVVGADFNTLQRRVSRIEEKIMPLVKAQLQRLCILLEP
jgi:hypothetical protein